MGAEIWVKVAPAGDPPPADRGELTFLAVDTRTPYTTDFDGADAGFGGPLHAPLGQHDRRKGTVERNGQRDGGGVASPEEQGRFTPMSQQTQEFTAAELQELTRVLVAEIAAAPPTIGVIGTSGTGKSSTLNAMFKTRLAISHVAACTKEFRATDLSVTVTQGEASGNRAVLRVVDAPGLGEDVARDPEYLRMYREHLPRCDVILWVLQARNRAVALDQSYLQQLSEFHPKLIFGINQVDLVEPRNWNTRINQPSDEQRQHITDIVADRAHRLRSALQRDVPVIPYSAAAPYNLPELFTAMVDSCLEQRSWIFSAIKGFRLEDMLPAGARERVMAILDGREPPKAPEVTAPLRVPATSSASPAPRRIRWYRAVVDWFIRKNGKQPPPVA